MDRLIDEIVKVSVQDAIASATATAVNTAAVLGVTTKENAKTMVCYDQDEVKTNFDTSELSYVTNSFFAEGDNPGRLVCIPLSASPTKANVVSALETAIGMGTDSDGRTVDFYHVIIRMDSEATVADVTGLINGDSTTQGLEDWCKENFRLAHIELSDRTIAEGVLTALATGTVPTRIAIYYHSEDNKKSLAAALVADRCGNDPARGTWAHKTLGSITADSTTKANLKNAQDKGLNIYCRIAGVDRTYMGTICSSTAFIDEVMKKDWLKFRTQEAVFNLLGSANNGDGVDYNDAGIAAVASAINSIFTTATDNEHRYVLPDSFEVQVPKYADISTDEKEKRNLPDVKVPFSIQASIHTVKTIELQVVA